MPTTKYEEASLSVSKMCIRDSLCDEVLFLYQGNIVEKISSDRLAFAENEYAQRLLNSVIPFKIS